VVLALGSAGAEVTVVARRPEAARQAALLAGPGGRVGEPDDVAAADLVVNATPVGMAGTTGEGRLAVDAGSVHRGQVVVDLVYHPRRTPLLAAAEAAGAQAVDGVGMLVHQAALAFRWWTGVEAPLDVMRAAALDALGG
jgi:shikimate dehydrogenase